MTTQSNKNQRIHEALNALMKRTPGVFRARKVRTNLKDLRMALSAARQKYPELYKKYNAYYALSSGAKDGFFYIFGAVAPTRRALMSNLIVYYPIESFQTLDELNEYVQYYIEQLKTTQDPEDLEQLLKIFCLPLNP